MGIAERRARHKTSLRRQILDAAREMFARDGYAAVSMRKLAERIEYSPTAIYLHFEDKDDLFRAVCDETFAGLVKRLAKQRRELAADPLACLTAGLHEYIAFGLKHPEHYIVTFMQPMRGDSPAGFAGSPGDEAFGFLRRAVADCVAARVIRPAPVEETAQVLWMSVHGLVSLLVAKPGFPFAAGRTLARRQVDVLVRGLQTA
jgi:AcrR family transcriptional regulator